jgi:hypothetical protein
LGIISVDFDATGRLLIRYSEFVKYLRQNRNKMKPCILFIDFKKASELFRREVLYNIFADIT